MLIVIYLSLKVNMLVHVIIILTLKKNLSITRNEHITLREKSDFARAVKIVKNTTLLLFLNRKCEKPMLEAIQSELESLVKTCFILSSRTTAHKFSRLLAMCME